MLLFGLASQGWMMYAVTALYCLGLGLLNPSVQGLMSRVGGGQRAGPAAGRDGQRDDRHGDRRPAARQRLVCAGDQPAGAADAAGCAVLPGQPAVPGGALARHAPVSAAEGQRLHTHGRGRSGAAGEFSRRPDAAPAGPQRSVSASDPRVPSPGSLSMPIRSESRATLENAA